MGIEVVREMPIQQFKEISWAKWLEIKTNTAGNYRKEIIKRASKSSPVRMKMFSRVPTNPAPAYSPHSFPCELEIKQFQFPS
ncbi:hypothetical protein [Lederbergia citri]|uniref:Uncharacterized protein n=1 Tax=Lederbergia citri TaxID=2833580 RepID=A0A942THF8_9BACI|nr:hypothetical protein [Lederbergia citri]MBS4196662.1 hypothetical protein [Lederbergia citri]